MEIPAVIRSRKTVSPFLQKLCLAPADPQRALPPFEAGQALELIAPRVRLIRRLSGGNRSERYAYERDPGGAVLTGRLALWYSIASSPEEAAARNEAEFLVSLHSLEGDPPRFLLDGEELRYDDQPRGDFTFRARAGDARQVVFAATGTGIAPVVSIIKHLDAEARAGRPAAAAVTVVHGHRSVAELGYFDELRAIDRAAAFDFLYCPMLTRAPHGTERGVGLGRVTDMMRSVLGQGGDVRLPAGQHPEALRHRMSGGAAVILACGSAAMIREMAAIAGAAGIRFEQEGW